MKLKLDGLKLTYAWAHYHGTAHGWTVMPKASESFEMSRRVGPFTFKVSFSELCGAELVVETAASLTAVELVEFSTALKLVTSFLVDAADRFHQVNRRSA